MSDATLAETEWGWAGETSRKFTHRDGTTFEVWRDGSVAVANGEGFSIISTDTPSPAQRHHPAGIEPVAERDEFQARQLEAAPRAHRKVERFCRDWNERHAEVGAVFARLIAKG